MELKEREEVKELLNNAIEIIEAEEGHTFEVKLKNGTELGSLIRVIQYKYDIGIGGKGKDREELFYELSENVKEED